MAAKRSLILNTRTMQPFEIGAQVDALLAFPGSDEDIRRRNVADALCARVIAMTIAELPDLAPDLHASYPEYALRRNRTSLNGRPKRHLLGQLTGHIVKPYLKEAMGECPLVMPAGTRISLPAFASHVLLRRPDDDDEAHADRVERFVKKKWPLWRPVAHLSSAYVVTAKKRNVPEIVVGIDIQNLDHHRAVVALANEHARHLRADRRLPWAEGLLVDLVWIE